MTTTPAKGYYWRSRAFIGAHVNIQSDYYPVYEALVRIRPAKGFVEGDVPEGMYLMDVYLKDKHEEIQNIYIRSYEIIDTFLDRVSLVGYAPAWLHKFISTCPAHVDIGKKFLLATSEIIANHKPVSISRANLDGLNDFNEDTFQTKTVKIIRNALVSGSVEERYLNLYAAIEQIADNETIENVKNICSNCKHETNGPKATSRYMRNLLADQGISNTDYEKLRMLRGKIAHGGGKRNQDFFKDLTSSISKIEGASLSLVASRSKTKIVKTKGVVVGLPISVHQCIRASNQEYDLIGTKWMAPIAFPEIKQLESDHSQTVVQAGVPLQNDRPIIDGLAWPDWENG